MRGRERPIDHAIRSLQTDLQRFTSSPLEEVALHLGELLNDITGQPESGQSASKVQPVVATVQSVLRRLPTTFGKRFLFDAALLQSIGNNWSPVASINPLLVPRIGSNWGHATVCLPIRCLPSQRGGELRVRHLDLILVPGEDRLEDIDLLSYAWIVHEVAHNFFFRHNSVFEAESRTILERKIRRLKLAASADRDVAKRRSQRLIQRMEEFWTPTSNHYNWAHELAVDLMALWVLGPAYLSVFVEMVESENPDAYAVALGHPPYELRTRSLLEGARRLGWRVEAVRLAERLETWHRLPGDKARTNDYIALADQHLMAQHVDLVLQVCHDSQVTRCTQSGVNGLAESVDQIDNLEFGINLLIQAWIVWERYGKDRFWRWQSSVVDAMSKRLTP